MLLPPPTAALRRVMPVVAGLVVVVGVCLGQFVSHGPPGGVPRLPHAPSAVAEFIPVAEVSGRAHPEQPGPSESSSDTVVHLGVLAVGVALSLLLLSLARRVLARRALAPGHLARVLSLQRPRGRPAPWTHPDVLGVTCVLRI